MYQFANVPWSLLKRGVSRKIVAIRLFKIFCCISIALSCEGRAFAQDRLSAFDPNIWSRQLPTALARPFAIRLTILPGRDIVIIGAGFAVDGKQENFALTYFGGRQAIWAKDVDEPAWVRETRGESGPAFFGSQIVETDGTTISFHYTYSFDESLNMTSLAFHGDISMPDDCKDPAANWIQVSREGHTEYKVLFYRFAEPQQPSSIGPCQSSPDNLFVPPYDRVRLVDPLLRAQVLQDGSILVASADDSYNSMPIVLRMRPDLSSPAIDGKSVFLLNKESVDKVRREALISVDARRKRGSGYDLPTFAQFASTIEHKLIELAGEGGIYLSGDWQR